jgi:hypothetical protein
MAKDTSRVTDTGTLMVCCGQVGRIKDSRPRRRADGTRPFTQQDRERSVFDIALADSAVTKEDSIARIWCGQQIASPITSDIASRTGNGILRTKKQFQSVPD